MHPMVGTKVRYRGWKPFDVPEHKLWFTAGDGVTNASGAASAIADVRSRGTRYTASQGTASARPTIAASLNSRATLDFAKANTQALVNTTDNPVTSGASRYVLVVAKGADTTGGALFCFRTGTTGGRVWALMAFDAGDTNFYYFTDGVSNNVVDAAGAAGKPLLTTPFIIEYELTLGAAPVVRFNGVSRTVSGTVNATADTGVTGFKIGAREAATAFWNGSIRDVFCASPIPSLADRSRLLNFFSASNGGLL